MLFYQGEDISFRLKGDSVVDFDNNDFWVCIYSAEGYSDNIEIEKDAFGRVGENVYDYTIGHDKTKDMLGRYNMEVLIKDGEDKRTIYKQERIFEVEFSHIKDVVE